ncbi:MAG: hypothetical protein WCF33_19900 [Pseudonocardiaceae bacterium]
MTAPEPMRGDIWSFLPTVAGRDKPSALGADRMLVLSTSTANAVLPTVLAVMVGYLDQGRWPSGRSSTSSRLWESVQSSVAPRSPAAAVKSVSGCVKLVD